MSDVYYDDQGYWNGGKKTKDDRKQSKENLKTYRTETGAKVGADARNKATGLSDKEIANGRAAGLTDEQMVAAKNHGYDLTNPRAAQAYKSYVASQKAVMSGGDRSNPAGVDTATGKNPFPKPSNNVGDLGDYTKDKSGDSEAQVKDSLNGKDYATTLKMVRNVDRYNSMPRAEYRTYDARGNARYEFAGQKPTVETEETREWTRKRDEKKQARALQMQQIMMKDRAAFEMQLNQWGLGNIASIISDLVTKDSGFAAQLAIIMTGNPSMDARQLIEYNTRQAVFNAYKKEHPEISDYDAMLYADKMLKDSAAASASVQYNLDKKR